MKILNLEDAKKLAEHPKLVRELEAADILIETLEDYIQTLLESLESNNE